MPHDQYEPGDVHAPVEETEVPLMIKILTVSGILAVLGAAGLVLSRAVAEGMIRVPF
ncbi:MAG: hypothetical protein IT326_09055 [Anaerolineae bacterium]|nr:hypothetical protein [Anaerolineae bacterium]